MMPINPADKGLMTWIGKNKYTFLLVVLLLGNIYQYIEGRKLEVRCMEDTMKLNETIKKIGESALEYERRRSEKLEYIVNNLSNEKK